VAKEIPLIPRKYVRKDGTVELWDLLEEGGPVRIVRTGILAREALGRDGDRFKLELPRGMKPGPAHAEAEARAAEEAAEAAAEADKDPVYGKRSQQ
jgi:hypothetical protein